MKPSKTLIFLSILVALLASVQAAAGLFWPNDGASFSFTTLYGETVEMNGQGLYHYDTAFRAPILRGADAVNLFFCVPLLVIALAWYGRGSQRGKLFLTGVLAFQLYNAVSITFGVAYNPLFLVYIAYFSASLFAFVLAVTSVDIRGLMARVTADHDIPRRGMVILLFLSGGALMFAWLSDLIAWLMPGAVPGVTSYTTEVTHALDLAIITPLTFWSGILLLRRQPQGSLYATILLMMLITIGVDVTIQTVFQMQAGISLPPGVLIGKAGSFVLLGLFAVIVLVRFFRCLAPAGRAQTAASAAD